TPRCSNNSHSPSRSEIETAPARQAKCPTGFLAAGNASSRSSQVESCQVAADAPSRSSRAAALIPSTSPSPQKQFVVDDCTSRAGRSAVARHRVPAIYPEHIFITRPYFHKEWRPDVLCCGSRRLVPPRSFLCRSYSSRRKTALELANDFAKASKSAA